MKQYPFAAALAVFAFSSLAGCAESTPPAASAPAEIGRDTAVSTARSDAADRFRAVDVATVAVMRSGRYWVVDLRTRDGGGLHYAIASDGTIRERRVMQ